MDVSDHEAEEGGFSGTGAAEDHEGFTAEDVEADGIEDEASIESFAGVDNLDDGFGHGVHHPR
jgi:hypothetical protein